MEARNVVDIVRYMNYTPEQLNVEIEKVRTYYNTILDTMFLINSPGITEKNKKSALESKNIARNFIGTFFADSVNRKKISKNTAQDTAYAYTMLWKDKVNSTIKDKKIRAVLMTYQHMLYTIRIFQMYLEKLRNIKQNKQ